MATKTKNQRTFGRGAEGTRNALDFMDAVRGRPRAGEAAGGSKARSLRLPDKAWAALEAEAQKRSLTVHKLLRMIIAEHLYTSDRLESRTQHQARLRGERKRARAVGE